MNPTNNPLNPTDPATPPTTPPNPSPPGRTPPEGGQPSPRPGPDHGINWWVVLGSVLAFLSIFLFSWLYIWPRLEKLKERKSIHANQAASGVTNNPSVVEPVTSNGASSEVRALQAELERIQAKLRTNMAVVRFSPVVFTNTVSLTNTLGQSAPSIVIHQVAHTKAGNPVLFQPVGIIGEVHANTLITQEFFDDSVSGAAQGSSGGITVPVPPTNTVSTNVLSQRENHSTVPVGSTKPVRIVGGVPIYEAPSRPPSKSEEENDPFHFPIVPTETARLLMEKANRQFPNPPTQFVTTSVNPSGLIERPQADWYVPPPQDPIYVSSSVGAGAPQVVVNSYQEPYYYYYPSYHYPVYGARYSFRFGFGRHSESRHSTPRFGNYRPPAVYHQSPPQSAPPHQVVPGPVHYVPRSTPGVYGNKI